MNDNNSTDRLTVMSYCAEFDMGRRIQAITRDVVVNIKGGYNHEKAGSKPKSLPEHKIEVQTA